MKTYILSILALLTVAAATSCASTATVTARQDPKTATSGTLGSVKANTVSLGETYSPQSKDSTLKRH